MEKIEFFRPSINKKDIMQTSQVLKSIFLTTGKKTEEFEQNFSKYIEQKYTIGLTSCTDALHLSLVALGIEQGDEVITTPMSFCATSNAIIHSGGRPVFVDVEEDTGNINAELIEQAITKKTKAIIPVHLYGQMCDMKRIRSIANKYNLKVIEDAAHAIEASREGIRVGQLSDSVCFSFYATKNITSGEGGAISTSSKNLSDKFRMLRLHGIDKSASDRYTKKYQHWDMPVLGWKCNMSNIQAAVLIGQLNRIDNLWNKREALWRMYEEGLKSVKGIRLLKTLPSVKHARHLFTILVFSGKRDSILKKLHGKGIGVAINYRPIHLLKYYRNLFGFNLGDFPIAEEIGKCTISLPLYPLLEKREVEYIICTLKKIV